VSCCTSIYLGGGEGGGRERGERRVGERGREGGRVVRTTDLQATV